jgi:ParB family chromosome partitioning protein
MAEEGKRTNLGRGLSALLGEEATDPTESGPSRETNTVPVEFLHPGRYQPRHQIDEAQIKDLSESIREKGILQPILVRRHPDEANIFEIIAGERRWRAAQLAQLHEVPIIVRDFSDREALEVALVENLQRQDLSPLEEAEGYNRLMEEFTHTQVDLAKALGKSRSHVANTMRLLGLPDAVKTMLDDRSLSAGHARALLNAKNSVKLARRVVRGGLNVRQTEKLVQNQGKGLTRRAKERENDTDTLALERDLTNLLGLKVEIKFQGISGTLVFHYSSLEQLDDILHRLSNGPQRAGGDAEMDDEIFEADPSTGGIPSDLLAAPLGSDEQQDQVANGHDENGPQKPLETLDTGAETHSDKD